MSLPALFNIILFFAVAITYALKLEDHFSYLKLIFPEELGEFELRADAQTRFSYSFNSKHLKIDLSIFYQYLWVDKNY